MTEARFEFGSNWYKYVRKNLTDERIAIAKAHLLDFLDVKDLNGIAFLDIGCGSGVHSLAAQLSGASKIHSFDYDEQSVAATEFCRAKTRSKGNWVVERGDVLDRDYMNGLGQWPLVYSWGVLHHTGDVWQALANAMETVAPDGRFYVALYSEDREKRLQYWLDIKERYANAGPLKKELMFLHNVLSDRMKWKPWKIGKLMRQAKKSKESRGMSLFTDIRDWLGGWPMQFVKDQDVVQFAEARGFSLEKIVQIEANTEFLFRRK